MSPEEELIRAGEAQRIIDSGIFKEACARVADSLADQRRRVPVRDTDMHTRLIITEQLWANLTDWLTQTAQTGQFAALTIKQRDSRFEAIKNGLFTAIRG
jgi:hypothetical protein